MQDFTLMKWFIINRGLRVAKQEEGIFTCLLFTHKMNPAKIVLQRIVQLN